MLALCEKAKKKGIAGWTYAGKYPYYLPFSLYPFIGKIGGREVLDAIDNLEPNAWKDPAVKAAFEAYYELYKKGYILKGTPGLDPHPVADRVDQGHPGVCDLRVKGDMQLFHGVNKERPYEPGLRPGMAGLRRRGIISSNIIRNSSRARWEPMQKCWPNPKERSWL